jgi:PAS domain S-box-containing protein
MYVSGAYFLAALWTHDRGMDSETGLAERWADAFKNDDAQIAALLSNMLNRFVYCKIITKKGKPVDYIYLDVNDTFERMHHLKKSDVVGKRATEVFPGIENDPGDWIGDYGRVALTGKPITFERYMQAANQWCRVHVYSPRKGYFISVSEDLAERRHAEEALRESEEKYRTLFATMSEGFAFHDVVYDEAGKPVDYRLLEVNAAFEQQTGLKSEDVIHKTIREVLHGIPDGWIETYGKVVTTGESAKFEEYSSDLDRWYEVYAFSPVQDRLGVVFTDITERKQAERELARRADALEAQAEILDLAHILIRDPDDHIVVWNSGAESLYGFSRQEAIGTNSHELLRTVFPESEEAVAEALRSTGHWDGELIHTAKDGRALFVASHQTLHRDAEGKPTAIIEVNNDITRLKQAEAAARAAEESKLQFYRRTIEAATNGKLAISEVSEIEKFVGPASAVWKILDSSDTRTMRHGVEEEAYAAGMDEVRIGHLLVCIGEAAANVVKHAGRGEASLHKRADALIVVVSDRGPGIPDLALPSVALRRGYSTVGTLGMGYKMMIQFADKVHLATGAEGTIVAIEMKLRPSVETAPLVTQPKARGVIS